MISIGVDPGNSGGIAFIYSDRKETTVETEALDKLTERDVWDTLREEVEPGPDDNAPIFALLERVHAMPKQGVSSTFKFGVSYGQLRMALIAAGIPFQTITPRKWQKLLGISPGKNTESKTQFKNRLKARAQELFPGVKVTHAVADALLIAEVCRRMKSGEVAA